MARIVNRQTEVPQVVAVNVATLSQGMKMMFEGCAMIFDSLGADGSVISAAAPDASVAEESKSVTKTADDPAKAEHVKEEENAETLQEAEPEADAQKAEVQEADVQKPESQKATPTETSKDPVSTVTVNDIIRIASAKITANRKNSEKIGALVRSYGVSKMSELPEDKFEAFLTDISQL